MSTNIMKRINYLNGVVLFISLCVAAMFLEPADAAAKSQAISVNDGDSKNVSVYVGDTGTIVPVLAPTPSPMPTAMPTADVDGEEAPADKMPDDSWETPEDNGTGENIQDIHFFYTVDTDNPAAPCLTVNPDGSYVAKAPGYAEVEIIGYNDSGSSVFFATIYFYVRVDMTRVTLAKTSLKGYLFPAYYYGKKVIYSPAEMDVRVNSQVVLNDDMYGVNVSCKSSSKKVSVDVSLENNILHLELSAKKKVKTVLTIQIAGKNFSVPVTLNPVGISNNSYLLVKGHSKKLKIKGYSGKIKWTSSNKKIASVSSKGKVKGRKIGNVVITAKIGDKRIGCAVSVTTRKLKKVCERATYMGTHWKYSQEKRTQSGYYDCSALVWKAYKQYAGMTFGDAGYPGTTATESAWCRDHKRMIKGGYSYKKIAKMKMNPGDLVFKSTDLKKKYSTTYHVEMFTGYVCQGYTPKGKPVVQSLWAARGPGYGAEEGSLLARPMK